MNCPAHGTSSYQCVNTHDADQSQHWSVFQSALAALVSHCKTHLGICTNSVNSHHSQLDEAAACYRAVCYSPHHPMLRCTGLCNHYDYTAVYVSVDVMCHLWSSPVPGSMVRRLHCIAVSLVFYSCCPTSRCIPSYQSSSTDVVQHYMLSLIICIEHADC